MITGSTSESKKRHRSKSKSKSKKKTAHIQNVHDLLNSKFSLRFIFLLSLSAFFFSLYTHFATYMGVSPKYVLYPFLGMFLIWLPIISIIKKINVEKRRTFNEYIVKYTPRWVRIFFIFLGIYCGIIFIFYIFNLTGLAAPHELISRNVKNRMEIFLTELTHGEMQNSKLYEARSFSAMWIIVFYSSMIIVLSKIRARSMRKKERTLKPGESPNRTPKLEM